MEGQQLVESLGKMEDVHRQKKRFAAAATDGIGIGRLVSQKQDAGRNSANLAQSKTDLGGAFIGAGDDQAEVDVDVVVAVRGLIAKTALQQRGAQNISQCGIIGENEHGR